MKQLLLLVFALLTLTSFSQNTAIDFTQDDCNGLTHNLYSELDSGKVVVMEFVMDCQLCVDAGIALQAMFTQLDQQYPGVIRVYQFAYSTLLDCAAMTLFKDTNSFQSTVFEENSHLLAHYGGFGMPTIGVAAGVSHTDIFSQVGFIASDTAQLGAVLRNYFSTISVNEEEGRSKISIYPNPASEKLFITGIENDFTFLLKDALGKEIETFFRSDENGISIDISSLSEGFYFVELHLNNNLVIKKILIRRL